MNYAFGILPTIIRQDSRVSDFACRLFSEVDSLSNKYGYCFATNKAIGKALSKSTATISRTLAELEALNYVNIVIEDGYKRKIYPKRDFREFEGVVENDQGGSQKCVGGYSDLSRGVLKNDMTANKNNITRKHNKKTDQEQLVETSLSTVVHDQVDEIELQSHHVLEDNAALPQLDADEGKEEKSKKKKAAAKNPDPTPINAMWDILLEQSAKIGNDEPQFMSRYGRDFKLLYAILKQRAEKRQEPITDQVEPFRRYVTKIVDYIIKGRKVPQHQFTANNLARNFNPGYLHTSFNQICATIQSGVTVTNQPNKPTAYNESEVYRNFDSSQAAF